MYNNKNQKYEVLNRFFISGKAYVRVQFASTRKEAVFPLEVVQSGEFEDVTVKPKQEEVMPTPSVDEGGKDVEETQEVVEETPAKEDSESDATDGLVNAISPSGDEIKVKEEDLDTFCQENDLNKEAVEACLDGKQKTHKSWRFERV